MNVNGEFIHNEFTQLDDNFVLHRCLFLKTEQLNEDDIARCMCIETIYLALLVFLCGKGSKGSSVKAVF